MISYDVIKSTLRENLRLTVDAANGSIILLKPQSQKKVIPLFVKGHESTPHLNDIDFIQIATDINISNGDIIRYDSDEQKIYIEYSAASSSNVLFLTTHCNNKCIMCPQSQCNDNGSFYKAAKNIIDLVDTPPEIINLTGGEPTFFKEKFIDTLSYIRKKWANTEPLILTNARTFNDITFAENVIAASEGKISFGIPLYSDSARIHDEIVGTNKAWAQTVNGIYNLAFLKAKIEIRTVIMRQNLYRLAKLINFIAANLPFVQQVSIMGMEPMGKARTHWHDLWIDPIDTINPLFEAIMAANNHNLRIYIYNYQLCYLPTSLHKYAANTISDWKQVYFECCGKCSLKPNCGGFFESQNQPCFYSRYFKNDYITTP